MCGLLLGCLSQAGCQLAFEKFEETILVRADLGQDDVIVTSLDVMIDRLKMPLS
jgi:hypothetical protein